MHNNSISTLAKKITNINHTELAFSSFLAIGGLAVGTLVNPGALVATALGIPLLMGGIMHYKWFNYGKRSFGLSGITEGLYQHSFKKWLKTYLQPNDNTYQLVEQKYKLLFINIWLSSKKIRINDLIKIHDTNLENISESLIKNKETKYYLDNLLFNRQSISYDSTKELPIIRSYLDVLEEDKDNAPKLNCIKNVYKDFQNIGLLGHYFISLKSEKNEIDFLAEMQNYILHKEDVLEIKKATLSFKNNKKQKIDEILSSSIMDYEILSYVGSEKDIIYKIISHPENYQHLSILKEYFVELKSIPTTGQNSYTKSLLSQIDNIFMHAQLDKELNNGEIIKQVKNSRKI